MGDVASVRIARSYLDAEVPYKAKIRYNTTLDELGVSNGTHFMPLDTFNVVYRQKPNTEIADEAFFTATRPCRVTAVSYVHSTASGGTFPAASAEVADGGTGYSEGDVLTLVGGTGTAATFTVTAVDAGVITTVALTTAGAYTVKPSNPVTTTVSPANGTGATLTITWASAVGTNVQVVKDTGTNAPGAGTNLLTNNSGVGFSTGNTANTVQVGTLSTTASDLVLAAGDRLSVDYSGPFTTLAGVVVSVELKYC